MMTRSSTARVIAEIVVAAVGVALVGCALAARQPWLDRHFLPSFFVPRLWYVLIETTVRVVIGLSGLAMAMVLRRPVARALVRAPHYLLTGALAVVLAVSASEFVLRQEHSQPTAWLAKAEEPLRQADDQLGWVLTPGRTGHATIGGRQVDYRIDTAGYRIAANGADIDPERPTIVFAGESVMFGEGLQWDETIPAQVEAMLGIQSANLAVHGYSSDQIYLRLEQELPRFRRPVAVVALFMTALFGRNLDRDRPHLVEPDLVWQPAEHASQLTTLATFLVPYRSDRTVTGGVRMTRDVLHAIVALTRARGATPLIVIPQFGTEDSVENTLRNRILDDQVPYVFATIDASWRLAWDRHPNARAAQLIAQSVALQLKAR